MVKYLSLFSGIGAFEKALERLNIPYELIGYCEIDKYADPTAYEGMKDVIREESEAENRVHDLMKVLKYIISSAGFELTERVRLKDKKTGKEYK